MHGREKKEGNKIRQKTAVKKCDAIFKERTSSYSTFFLLFPGTGFPQPEDGHRILFREVVCKKVRAKSH